MACVALQVVGGLVEVPHPWDVVLPRLPDDPARVGDHDRRVPECLPVLEVALQDRVDNHHVVLLGILKNANVKKKLATYSRNNLTYIDT